MQNKDQYFNYIDFEKKVVSGKIEPVYFVLVEDNYFLNKAGQLLKEKLTGSRVNNENFFVKYADDTSVDEILNLSSNFSSLFSQNKIIIVKRCEKFGKRIEGLFDYARNPDSETTLLLVFEKEYVTEKKLDRAFQFYDFTSLPDIKYFEWLISEFHAQGCSIDENTLEMFSEYVPRSFDLVVNEIRKVSDYLEDEKEKKVTKEVILKLSGYESEFTPNELMIFIVTKDCSKALKVLDYLLNKESLSEIFLLNVVSSMFLDLLAVRSESIQNIQYRDFYSKYKIWGDRIAFVRRFQNQAKTMNFDKIFEILLETDQKLKTSMLDPKTLLFSLVQEISSN